MAIAKSYRFPVVGPLFLNAGPQKKCPHHLLLYCSLCRKFNVWAVRRKSLFDIKNPPYTDCRNRQFPLGLPVLRSRANCSNSTGSYSALHNTQLHNDSLSCTGNTLLLLSHTLFIYCHQWECFCTYCCALIVCCDCAKYPTRRFPETLQLVSLPVMQWKNNNKLTLTFEFETFVLDFCIWHTFIHIYLISSCILWELNLWPWRC